MNVNIEITEEQLNKLGVSEPQDIQDRISKLIDDMPCSFIAKCISNIGYNDTLYWKEGYEYRIEYRPDIIMADSEKSDFCSTHLAEFDFMDCFKVVEAEPNVAKAMCDEGYGDMFVDFLDKEKEKELIKAIRKDMETMPFLKD